MPKLISVYKDSEIISCPKQWERHKGFKGECSVYESENKQPGKKWFYFIYDRDQMNFGYFHCSMGDMEEDAENGTIIFTTHDGENEYIIKVGEKMPEDYLPYRIIGHGDETVLVASDGTPLSV